MSELRTVKDVGRKVAAYKSRAGAAKAPHRKLQRLALNIGY